MYLCKVIRSIPDLKIYSQALLRQICFKNTLNNNLNRNCESKELFN